MITSDCRIIKKVILEEQEAEFYIFVTTIELDNVDIDEEEEASYFHDVETEFELAENLPSTYQGQEQILFRLDDEILEEFREAVSEMSSEELLELEDYEGEDVEH